MCVGTLVHISRHLDRTSNNNNKRCQLIIHCMFCRVFFHRVLLWTSGFMIIIIIIVFYMLTSCLITCILFHQSPALVILYHTCSLLDITCYLSACSCIHVLKTWFLVHAFWLGFIDTRVHIYARHLSFITPLVEEFLTPLDPHVQIPELGACGFSQLLIRDAQL